MYVRAVKAFKQVTDATLLKVILMQGSCHRSVTGFYHAPKEWPLQAAYLGCIGDSTSCVDHVIHKHRHFILDIPNQVHHL